MNVDEVDFSTEVQMVLLMLSVFVARRIGIQLGSVVGLGSISK